MSNVQLNQVRIIPKGIGYCLEIIYTKELEIRKGKAPDSSRVTSIDLGVRNLVTLATNIGERPIVVKGGIVKSINQYYNKCKAHFQSIADRQGIKTSHRLQRLSLRRHGKLKDYFHKLSRRIVEWYVQHNIGTIVIGYNERWKQQTTLGRQNNQTFVTIPFYQLVNQISYKAEEEGIQVIKQEESYTSKCSFLDNESIEHHDRYRGRRITRGLFRAGNGTIINADVNAAYNILRKAIPNALSPWERADRIEGIGLGPVRLSHEENWLLPSGDSS